MPISQPNERPENKEESEDCASGYYEKRGRILHYNKNDSENSFKQHRHVDLPKITWRIKQDGKWSDDNNPGVPGYPIQAVAIDFKGFGWYQVCTIKHGWLERVHGYDTEDCVNGFAGRENSPIIAIRCHYDIQEFTDETYTIKYRVSNLGKVWSPYQYDNNADTNQDGYAGDMVPIDRFEISLVAV